MTMKVIPLYDPAREYDNRLLCSSDIRLVTHVNEYCVTGGNVCWDADLQAVLQVRGLQVHFLRLVCGSSILSQQCWLQHSW